MRAIRRRVALANDRGETLVELLVAISILGIGIIALVGGLMVAITGSTEHRGRASADSLARSAAECIKDRSVGYAENGQYGACTGSGVTVAAKWWDGASTVPPAFVATQNTNGLQELTVTATSGGTSESVTILKRQT
ncbi:MAG: prepilin-type N-terminal cleavage/methylation domain-containing protein [Mycetocola sp.]